jgi:hypothetical protein
LSDSGFVCAEPDIGFSFQSVFSPKLLLRRTAILPEKENYHVLKKKKKIE